MASAADNIWTSSDSHRDLGWLLMFTGLATSFPLRRLVATIYKGSWVDLLGVLGFVLVVVGFALMRFTRKQFTVRGNSVSIKDGLFSKPLTFHWEEPPRIRLRSLEEEHGREHLEFWQVYLLDGKRQYVMERREGHQIEVRSLAEALAKAINCPLLEKGESGEITIPREELDLPFRERVRRYPDLLGSEASRPLNCPVHEDEVDGSHRFRWRLLSPGMLGEWTTLFFLLTLLAVVPIFPAHTTVQGETASFQLSFLLAAQKDHDWTYFYVCGGLLAASAFWLFGYSKELRVTRQALLARDRLWGVPIWSATIPTDQLEEIWVRQGSRGAKLQLISDARIFTSQVRDVSVAAWLAARLRRLLIA